MTDPGPIPSPDMPLLMVAYTKAIGRGDADAANLLWPDDPVDQAHLAGFVAKALHMATEILAAAQDVTHEQYFADWTENLLDDLVERNNQQKGSQS